MNACRSHCIHVCSHVRTRVCLDVGEKNKEISMTLFRKAHTYNCRCNFFQKLMEVIAGGVLETHLGCVGEEVHRVWAATPSGETVHRPVSAMTAAYRQTPSGHNTHHTQPPPPCVYPIAASYMSHDLRRASVVSTRLNR